MAQRSIIEVKKGKDTKGRNFILIRAKLSAYVKKEKPGMYVSYCPLLDICTQGDTVKEARENIIEATQLFVESCFEDGTLHDVLLECGFVGGKKLAHKQRAVAKPKGFFGGREINIPAEIPYFAVA